MRKRVKLLKKETIHKSWSEFIKITFEYQREDGVVETKTREIFDRGNGAAILLYDVQRKTVILTRQFRIPSFINGNQSGFLIESCAGQLDMDAPEACAIRETREETGYEIKEVQKVFEAYMSPGGTTEILYFFIAPYSPDMKIHSGGGVVHEQEEIEVLELDYPKALDMVDNGQIRDAKTIMLLQHLRLKGIL